jgi:hypothetical protein
MNETLLINLASFLTHIITTKGDHFDPLLIGSLIYELLNSIF